MQRRLACLEAYLEVAASAHSSGSCGRETILRNHPSRAENDDVRASTGILLLLNALAPQAEAVNGIFIL
jgi:hypothetical protein